MWFIGRGELLNTTDKLGVILIKRYIEAFVYININAKLKWMEY